MFEMKFLRKWLFEWEKEGKPLALPRARVNHMEVRRTPRYKRSSGSSEIRFIFAGSYRDLQTIICELTAEFILESRSCLEHTDSRVSERNSRDVDSRYAASELKLGTSSRALTVLVYTDCSTLLHPACNYEYSFQRLHHSLLLPAP